jgi:hypothetical protein
MTLTPARGRTAAWTVIPVTAGIVLMTGLTGCKATVAATEPATTGSAAAPAAAEPVQSSATLPSPVTPGAASAAPGTASPAAAVAASGTAPASGSLSVSITSPVTVSGTVPAPVSCVAGGISYRAAVTATAVNADEVTFSVAIGRYRGPGSYPAVVAATLREPSGTVTTVGGVSRVPAVITASGGSFSVSATGSGGRTFTGTLAWTCA